ncbi:hypothetical protein JHK86_006868 [Glycine max]|nr:hypothetical protein JHK86_006868 [Glycine max]
MMYLEAIESSHLSRDILDDIPAKYVDGATICEELNTMAKEHEKNPMIMPGRGLKGCISKDLLCEHKEDSGVTHFALGLCEACYKNYDKVQLEHDFQTYFASLTVTMLNQMDKVDIFVPHPLTNASLLIQLSPEYA